MTTLESEQKDILEKLNEIALEANWGTVERVNCTPKAVAVIQEAMEEIKRLRELPKEILGGLGNIRIHPALDRLKDFEWFRLFAKKYGVEIDENAPKQKAGNNL